jgi:hypothetical protein
LRAPRGRRIRPRHQPFFACGTVAQPQIRLRADAPFGHARDVDIAAMTAGLELSTDTIPPRGKKGEDAMSIRIVVATVLVLGTFGAVSSGARAETQSDRDACIGDVHEHCGEFIPNRDAIVACLKQKIKKISHACRVVMTRPYPKNAQSN